MNRRIILLSLILLVLLTPVAHAQRAEGRLASPAGARAVGGGNAPTTWVRDEGFENAYTSAELLISDDWKVESSVFGSPICTVAACAANVTYAAPDSGSHWAYFGGISDAETGYIEQKIVLPATPYIHLEYHVWHSFAGVTPTLTLSVDSVVVDTLPAGTTAGYVDRIVDISAYADGKSHKLRFSYSKPGSGFADVSIDSITLYKGQNYSPIGAGFETDADFWTVKRGTGDKVKCNTDTRTFSFQGDCAFRFKGGAGEKSQLKQSYMILRDLPPGPHRAPPAFSVYAGAFVNGPASLQGTLKLKLTLSDDSVLKSKVILKGKGKYKWVQTPSVKFSSELGIIAVLIGFKHTSASGKSYIDNVEAFVVEDYS